MYDEPVAAVQPVFSAVAGLCRGAAGEVVVGRALVEQAVEEVGWVGEVGRS